MRIHYVTGGARSGKSTFAVQTALDIGRSDVTFIATATPCDQEMVRRISEHRRSRPQTWTIIEVPTRAAPAIRNARTRLILMDCLTLLVSNILLANADNGEAAVIAAVDNELDEIVDAAHSRDGILIVVTNEVGMGVVPDTDYGRWFRDVAGRANQRIAALAERATLLVSGIPLQLKG